MQDVHAAQNAPGRSRRTSVIGMTALGALQGVCCYALLSPALAGTLRGFEAVMWMMSLMLVMTVPLLWYFTENLLGLSTLRRVAIVAVLGLIIPIMLTTEYTVMQQREFPQTSSAPLIASAVLAFICLPLLAHLRHGQQPGRGLQRTVSGWHWSYPDLFQTTWRNVIAFSTALLLALIGVLLLAAMAAGLRLVGIGLIGQILFQPATLFAAYATLFGAAIGLLLAKGTWLIAARRFLLARKYLLPLAVGTFVIWTLVKLQTQQPPPQDQGISALLAGLLTLLLVAVNTRYQDGLELAKPSRFARIRMICVCLLAIAALGFIALTLIRRVNEHGWSANLVWAVFIWVLAAGYLAGYAAGMIATKRGWMWSLAPTNIAMGAVLCVGVLLLATPLADARSLAAQDQIQRLLNGDTPAASFNYEALARNNDRYGRDALKYLSQLDPKVPNGTAIIAGARLALDITTTKSDK
ncbi:DUF4153 domain-containing protein [Pigmentiphaga aceris]|nr:DUF4153 domain-containing protein [Pigmentiphaga aceris]